MDPLQVPQLPLNIIIEILSWLPVESLLRFKSVRRQWGLLIGQDMKFMAKHMVRANPMCFESDDKFKVHRICAGWCLEESVTSPSNWRIRNPATRQVVPLPYPRERLKKMEFVFNSLTNEFKVINAYIVEGNGLLEVEIITIRSDHKWRPLNLPNETLLIEGDGKDVLMKQDCLPLEKGVLHFTEIVTNLDDWYLQVHSLDVGSECYTTTILPKGSFPIRDKVKTFLWDGCPAVADVVEGALKVLVLEDFEEHKWSKNKISIPLEFLKEENDQNEIAILATWDHDRNEIAILAAWDHVIWFDNGDKQYWYNMRTRKFQEDDLTGETGMKDLVPSLVAVELMTPENDVC